ncbi:MAG: helix-turn-helix domain-containing protein [Rhodobacteraceae bacterium]|nr:helix-turn-helix domain-containing protein [Paracoccaceae bacterium]
MDDMVPGPEWYSPESSTFGDRVAGARESLGMSQGDLARRLGVKLKTVQGWEGDTSEPRANKLQMLAGVLNVSLTWLLTAEGDGIDGPFEAAAIPEDLSHLLVELRTIRGEMTRNADRLGRLEKRLRQMLNEPAA